MYAVLCNQLAFLRYQRARTSQTGIARTRGYFKTPEETMAVPGRAHTCARCVTLVTIGDASTSVQRRFKGR